MRTRLIAVLLAIILLAACASAEKPQSVDELLTLGEQYLLDLDYEQALVQFLKVIETEPMNARAYLGAASAYVGLGDVDSAIAILEQGLEATGDESLREMLERLSAPEDERILRADEGGMITLNGAAMPFTPAYFESINVPWGMTVYEFADAHITNPAHRETLIAKVLAFGGSSTGYYSGISDLGYPTFHGDLKICAFWIGNETDDPGKWQPAYWPGNIALGMPVGEAIAPFVVPGSTLEAFVDNPTFENAVALSGEAHGSDGERRWADLSSQALMDVGGYTTEYEISIRLEGDGSHECRISFDNPDTRWWQSYLLLKFQGGSLSEIEIEHHYEASMWGT